MLIDTFVILFGVLIITIILELFVFLFLIKEKFKELLIGAILINSITNPLANSFLFLGIIVIEFFVILTETFLIKYFFKVGHLRAFITSLIANLISFIFGALLLFH